VAAPDRIDRERFTGAIELFLPFGSPLFDFDIVRSAVALVGIQLVGVIYRDRLSKVRSSRAAAALASLSSEVM
jgi:hypothetical protein